MPSGRDPSVRRASLVVGHRGAPRVAPENTFPSFDAALATGADGIELDVRLSRDGVPVVMHDAAVDRTTDGVGSVADLDAAQLARMSIGASNRIPTLSGVLERYALRTRLFIELKTEPGADTRAGGRVVGQALADIRCAHSPVALSFDAEALEGLREVASGIARCVLRSSDATPSAPERRALVKLARELEATYVGLSDASLSQDAATDFHRHALSLYTWPNVEPLLINAGLGLGVDVMATDDPRGLIRRIRRQA